MDLPERSPQILRGARLEAKKKPFLDAFSRIGTISGAADHVGINRTTIYVWKKQDPAFREELARAEDVLTQKLESIAIDKALQGNETMLIFLLKARAPQKYTERYRHEVESEQFSRLLGLLVGVVKRSVPQTLWPVVARELDNVANLLEMGESTQHLLQ